ncbi:MAG: hypothetical protein R3309_01320 [Reinekea sp.]|nr:hypothetical protein [Reinekea sp.]
MSETYAQIRGWSYVPHITFSEKAPIQIDIRRRRVAVMLGTMHEYKQIDIIVSEWNLDLPLKIIGRCGDQYFKKLNAIKASKTNGNLIQIENRELSDTEYDETLLQCKYVLISFSLQSAYVSGAIHHALSFGCIPIMYPSLYRNELIAQGLPILKVEEFAADIDDCSPKFESYFLKFGTASVANAWKQLVGSVYDD